MRVRGKPVSCCFTGHRPAKLPWGTDESDERCLRLKARLREVSARAVEDGYTHFICGMAEGWRLLEELAQLGIAENQVRQLHLPEDQRSETLIGLCRDLVEALPQITRVYACITDGS